MMIKTHVALPTALVGAALFACQTNAFQAPLPVAAQHVVAATPTYWVLAETGHSISSAKVAAAAASSGSSVSLLEHTTTADNNPLLQPILNNLHQYLLLADGGALDIVRNIAVGITAVVFLLAGVTFLYASFIIPVAAKELEQECKELNPELWKEYEAKLGEGETLGSRPDLMQEMGVKLQPLIEAKIRAMDANKDGGGGADNNKSRVSIPTPLETTMSPFPTKKTVEVQDAVMEEKTSFSADQWDSDEQKK